MGSQELSEEIFNLEKNLTQMKKDYKNLLTKSRNNENSRSEMNEMAVELEQKTELFIWAKKLLKKKMNL